MRSARLFLVIAGLLPLLAPAGRAQEMTLETLPGAESLVYCDMLHSTSCSMIHNDTTTALNVGGPMELDGEPYVITWLGPAYYLETGVVLEALGDPVADLKGQRWIEHKPRTGKVHVSREWKDTDQNGALSSSDTLTLDDGPAVKVKDVRLHVRVRPMPRKEQKEQREK